MERRILPALALALTLAGCQDRERDQPNRQPWLQPVPTEQSLNADIVRYYPEILNYKEQDRGTVTSILGTQINWYNFVDNATFKPQAALAALEYYQHFQTLPKDRFVVNIHSEKGARQAIISLGKTDVQIPFFIVPEDAPKSQLAESIPSGIVQRQILAKTLYDTSSVARAAYITYSEDTNDPLLSTPEGAMNRRIFTELCQITMRAEFLQSSNDDIAQEVWCNGLSRAFTYKQANIPYQSYAEHVSSLQVEGYGFPYLSRSDYEAIPAPGPAFAKD